MASHTHFVGPEGGPNFYQKPWTLLFQRKDASLLLAVGAPLLTIKKSPLVSLLLLPHFTLPVSVRRSRQLALRQPGELLAQVLRPVHLHQVLLRSQ